MTGTFLMAPQMDGVFYWEVSARWPCPMYSWLPVCSEVGGPDRGGGQGLPHHPKLSQCDGRDLENQGKIRSLNQPKNRNTTFQSGNTQINTMWMLGVKQAGIKHKNRHNIRVLSMFNLLHTSYVSLLQNTSS